MAADREAIKDFVDRADIAVGLVAGSVLVIAGIGLAVAARTWQTPWLPLMGLYVGVLRIAHLAQGACKGRRHHGRRARLTAGSNSNEDGLSQTRSDSKPSD